MLFPIFCAFEQKNLKKISNIALYFVALYISHPVCVHAKSNNRLNDNFFKFQNSLADTETRCRQGPAVLCNQFPKNNQRLI